MIYFTSDTHFYRSSIIELIGRPFKDLDDMHKSIIRNWNTFVSDRDEIYILGDFINIETGIEANEILKKLKGKKYLIRGNHDKYLDNESFERDAFEWIKDYYILNYKKIKFILFHYPILEWAGYFHDSIHLYGHVHTANKDPKQKNRLDILGNRAFNVGVDVNNYFPVSIDTILKNVNYKN